MKLFLNSRLFALSLLFLLAVPLSVSSENKVIDIEERVYFSPEKELKIVQVAKEICSEYAPDFDLTGLTPVIYAFGFEHPCPFWGNRKMVSVKFMKDSTDFMESNRLNPKTKEFEKCRRPKSIIHAEVFPDTMEPAGIGQYYGTLFIPSYQEFRQKNPGYRVVKTETPEYINNLRNVNEVAKEELEKQGYKVTIGKVGN